MGFTYKLNLKPWRNQTDAVLKTGIARMSLDILNMAMRNAPYRTGALRSSGRTTRVSQYSYAVSFGNSQVNYAYYREFHNNLHPGTRFYLKRAGQSAQARMATYFRKV